MTANAGDSPAMVLVDWASTFSTRNPARQTSPKALKLLNRLGFWDSSWSLAVFLPAIPSFVVFDLEIKRRCSTFAAYLDIAGFVLPDRHRDMRNIRDREQQAPDLFA